MDSEKLNERLTTKGDEDFRSLQQKYLMQCWGVQRDYSPIAVEKTDGCWIHTMDGRKIFDLRSAHECINLGFRHPKILQTMRDQMEKYAPNVLTKIVEYLLREKNIYIRADKFGIWIFPPLIVKKEEIDFIVDSIDEALKIADDEVTE